MKRYLLSLRNTALALAAGALVCAPVLADELLQMIQADLEVLGYDPGPADGQLTMKTQLAIGKFEEANSLPVTGQPSLAVAAALSNQADAARAGGSAVADEAAAQARLECLQQVAAEKEARQQRGRQMRSLARSGANIAGRFGGVGGLARDIDNISRTADDVTSMANDLGLTPEEAAACD